MDPYFLLKTVHIVSATVLFGTGLGIPVAYKICRSHGWDLAFAAVAGGGTEVTISAPLPARGEPR